MSVSLLLLKKLLPIVILVVMPTIETCFNCFGIHSSDAREIIKRRQNQPGNLKFTQTLSTPPPPLLGGEGGVDKMALGPEGEICFALHNRPVGKKLYSLLIVSI